MSNCKFPDSFTVCSQISARLRQVSNGSDFSPVAVSAAWRGAEIEFEKMFPPLVAAPKPKPPAAPKPEVPSEMRPPLPLPTSFGRCKHGLYYQGLWGACLGSGASRPFELTNDSETVTPEVEELLPDSQAIVEAGMDDAPELTDVPESAQDEIGGDEIAEKGLTEVECE